MLNPLGLTQAVDFGGSGARNHLPANRSLGFCFEILI